MCSYRFSFYANLVSKNVVAHVEHEWHYPEFLLVQEDGSRRRELPSVHYYNVALLLLNCVESLQISVLESWGVVSLRHVSLSASFMLL